MDKDLIAFAKLTIKAGPGGAGMDWIPKPLAKEIENTAKLLYHLVNEGDYKNVSAEDIETTGDAIEVVDEALYLWILLERANKVEDSRIETQLVNFVKRAKQRAKKFK